MDGLGFDSEQQKTTPTNRNKLSLNVNIEHYEKKTFLTFDSLLSQKAAVEERDGVSFICSRSYKELSFSLEQYLLKHGNTIAKQQRFAYSSKTVFPVEFLGSPYIVLGDPTYLCEFGNKQWSEKRATKLNEDRGPKRKRNVSKATKKMSCSCRISVRQLLVFKKITVDTDTQRAQHRARTKLCSLLEEWSSGNHSVEYLHETTGAEIVFYAWFPKEEAHDADHLMKEQNYLRERVHPKIVEFIHCLASVGERSAAQIQRNVRNFVLNEFSTQDETPDFNRRRFNPCKKTIYNIVNRYMRNVHKGGIIDSIEFDCIETVEVTHEVLPDEISYEIQLDNRIATCYPEESVKAGTSDIRILLKKLEALTYLVEDEHTIQEVKASLENSVNKFELLANNSREAELPVAQKKLKTTKVKRTRLDCDIPVKTKDNLLSTVGVSAERKRKDRQKSKATTLIPDASQFY